MNDERPGVRTTPYLQVESVLSIDLSGLGCYFPSCHETLMIDCTSFLSSGFVVSSRLCAFFIQKLKSWSTPHKEIILAVFIIRGALE